MPLYWHYIHVRVGAYLCRDGKPPPLCCRVCLCRALACRMAVKISDRIQTVRKVRQCCCRRVWIPYVWNESINSFNARCTCTNAVWWSAVLGRLEWGSSNMNSCRSFPGESMTSVDGVRVGQRSCTFWSVGFSCAARRLMRSMSPIVMPGLCSGGTMRRRPWMCIWLTARFA